MPKLKLPPYGKHILFLGSTGSGKSYLAEIMLQYYSSWLALDTQDSLEKLKGHKIKTPRNLGLLLKLFPKIRYIPRPEWMTKDAFDYIFKSFLESSTKKKPRPRVLYVDEIYHIGYGVTFPSWLPKGITTARQRKLSFWIATQRPRMIPGPVLTEASKMYVFYLSKYDDMKFISGFCRTNPKELLTVLQQQQDDYSFIEIDLRKGTWVKYPKIKEV